MTYVIAQGCCNDASCVSVCPVDCIRPRPGDPDFMSAEQLYIDPNTCIQCGACMWECPVEAVYDESNMPAELDIFREINAEYFQAHPLEDSDVDFDPGRSLTATQPLLRVAVIGAGPAGCYATEALSDIAGVEVSLFDRLPTPYGLVRAGVAPDHQKTKGVTSLFEEVLSRPNVSCFFNVRIGEHLSVDDILERHHAVIFANGADADRKLDVPGQDLPGVHTAREFVSWYNGHPEHVGRSFDLAGERAIIIGNGNVALDAARVLAAPASHFDATDMAQYAVNALQESAILDVVVAARRAAVDAAYTTSEMSSLSRLEGVAVVAQPDEVGVEVSDERLDTTFGARRKLDLARQAAERNPAEGDRTITFRYLLTPVSIQGEDKVTSVTFRRTGAAPTDPAAEITIDASLVLFATGYRGSAMPGVPFDEALGTIPNTAGRVLDSPGGDVLPRLYCTGWSKRGATGVIGSNRVCSTETVDQLFEDYQRGQLQDPPMLAASVEDFVAGRQPQVVRYDTWLKIDEAERARGAQSAVVRPRDKFHHIAEMIDAATL